MLLSAEAAAASSISPFEIISTLIAVLAVATSVIAFLYSRRRDADKDSAGRIQQMIRDGTAGLAGTVDKNTLNITDLIQRTVPDLQKLLDKTADRLDTVISRTGVLETKIDVFWKNVAFDAARILHSPHTPELDVLLEKLGRDELIPVETARLIEMLAEVSDDRSAPSGNRIAAVIILRIIELGMP